MFTKTVLLEPSLYVRFSIKFPRPSSHTLFFLLLFSIFTHSPPLHLPSHYSPHPQPRLLTHNHWFCAALFTHRCHRSRLHPTRCRTSFFSASQPHRDPAEPQRCDTASGATASATASELCHRERALSPQAPPRASPRAPPRSASRRRAPPRPTPLRRPSSCAILHIRWPSSHRHQRNPRISLLSGHTSFQFTIFHSQFLLSFGIFLKLY